ncbi:hypothetical protein, partial [Streptomyces hygroscopicus]|uniref:hypothetical protein n=1 Tax=Streptomyces hygroscopicus TaxID=1912 RepID=UPI0036CF0202
RRDRPGRRRRRGPRARRAAVVAAPADPSAARGACARAAGGAKLVTGGTGRSGAKFSRGGGEEVARSRV